MVSVICVCYNSEMYINEAIDSVLEQSFDEYEIIVIDDGSEDSTITKLSKYRTLNNFTLIEMKHTGNPGFLRNEAVRCSKYELIAFIDSDDVWFPDKLSKQIEFIQNYDMICTNAERLIQKNIVFDSILSRISDSIFRKNNTNIAPNVFFEDLIGNIELTIPKILVMNYVIPSSVLVKKSAFLSSGMFEQSLGKRGEDYLLWLMILKRYKVILLKEILIKYRIHEKNLSLQSYDERIKLLERTIDIRKEYLSSDNEEISSSAKIGCKEIYHELGKLALAKRNFDSSAYYFLRYVHLLPIRPSIELLKYSLIFVYVKLCSIFARR
ncbi:MAG TPA: glycosyltransferase [Ignavibacteria bacterium]|nr:glycosyltransferase [Ignavibacteria bacterium]HMQ98040.1 glycosyltransferase [Ignavibacteria bacterium]